MTASEERVTVDAVRKREWISCSIMCQMDQEQSMALCENAKLRMLGEARAGIKPSQTSINSCQSLTRYY